jgi:histidinol dehydrogenase
VVGHGAVIADRLGTVAAHEYGAGAQTLGRIAVILAEGEGLQAHARSAEYRLRRS